MLPRLSERRDGRAVHEPHRHVAGAVAPEDVGLAVAVEVALTDDRPGARHGRQACGLQYRIAAHQPHGDVVAVAAPKHVALAVAVEVMGVGRIFGRRRHDLNCRHHATVLVGEDMAVVDELAELRERVLNEERRRSTVAAAPLRNRAIAVLIIRHHRHVCRRNRQRDVVLHDAGADRRVECGREQRAGRRRALRRSGTGSGGCGSCGFRSPD